ncbi:hypothetical protein [Candidatus Phyllobacterium onerii]|uniref:hypothetical protein n=1 Tax=Candidatus Phyllobacterium onerii TaxID=3020828 RepID=UPI00232BD5AF|nr:hypothetical protein [Phyllobacterium sp. IY22]
MSDEEQKKRSNKAKQPVYDGELRKELVTRYKTVPTDVRFKELLDRLDNAERKK